jgi:membrane protease YdiL (CAAX protease family)
VKLRPSDLYGPLVRAFGDMNLYLVHLAHVISVAGFNLLFWKHINSINLSPPGDRTIIEASSQTALVFVMPVQVFFEEVATRFFPLIILGLWERRTKKKANRWLVCLVLGVSFGLLHLTNVTADQYGLAVPYIAMMSMSGFFYVYMYQRWGLAGCWYSHTLYNESLLLAAIVMDRTVS